MSRRSASLPWAMPARGTLPLAVLLACLFIGSGLTTPLLERLVRQPFGLNHRQTSWFLGAAVLAGLLAAPWAGRLSDRTGRRRPWILLGTVGSALSLACMPLAGSYPVLVALHFGEGGFGMVAITQLMARALDLSPPDRRGPTFALLGMAIPLGYLLGPVLTGLHGNRPLTPLFAGVGMLMLCGGLLVHATSGGSEGFAARAPGSAGTSGSLLRNAAFVRGPLLMGFVAQASFGFLALLTSPVVSELQGNGGSHGASVALTGFWLCYIIACPLAGWLCRRLGTVRPMLAGAVAYGVALASLGSAGSLESFVAGMMLCGLFSAMFYIPCQSLIGEIVPRDRNAAATGLFHGAGTLGMICGLIAGGVLGDIGKLQAYAAGGGLAIIGALLAAPVLLTRRAPSPAPEPAPTKP